MKRAIELLEKLQKSEYFSVFIQKSALKVYHPPFPGGEVPPAKLAALQKVLQSDFLNAVREVYEHVYETVDIQGSQDIRASATAKVRFHIYDFKVFLSLEL